MAARWTPPPHGGLCGPVACVSVCPDLSALSFLRKAVTLGQGSQHSTGTSPPRLPGKVHSRVCWDGRPRESGDRDTTRSDCSRACSPCLHLVFYCIYSATRFSKREPGSHWPETPGLGLRGSSMSPEPGPSPSARGAGSWAGVAAGPTACAGRVNRCVTSSEPQLLCQDRHPGQSREIRQARGMLRTETSPVQAWRCGEGK